ncbi:MAG TPA: acyl carrier protein [Arenicellales bacterium]|nr:acyl carrier protein [Arenicellales bacterium]
MTEPKSDIEQVVRDTLAEIAPEAEAGSIDPDRTFRDQFDFDSMDFLALMMALNKKLGIHIPETDYPRLSSLSGCVRYLEDTTRNGAGTA